MPTDKSVALLERERFALERWRPGSRRRRVDLLIRASWARCEERGLPIEGLQVPFRGEFDIESRLTRCAAPVLSALQSSLANEPISIMLCDDAGFVLTRNCNDRAILKALDDVALAPGSNYSEAAVGTNGFGLALADNRLALVAGADHYNTRLVGYTCAGAPIHDPETGDVLGALSLTTWSDERPDLLAALAGQTAMNIETQLANQAGARSAHELDGCLPASASRRRVSTESSVRINLTRFEAMERDAVLDALERNHGVVGRAAEDLGISRATMYRKIKHYGVRVYRTTEIQHVAEFR